MAEKKSPAQNFESFLKEVSYFYNDWLTISILTNHSFNLPVSF